MCFKKSDGTCRSERRYGPLLGDWTSRYPIISLEDGLAEDDWDGWASSADLSWDAGYSWLATIFS